MMLHEAAFLPSSSIVQSPAPVDQSSLWHKICRVLFLIPCPPASLVYFYKLVTRAMGICLGDSSGRNSLLYIVGAFFINTTLYTTEIGRMVTSLPVSSVISLRRVCFGFI